MRTEFDLQRDEIVANLEASDEAKSLPVAGRRLKADAKVEVPGESSSLGPAGRLT